MRAIGPALELSASDLSQFLGCRHRTALDLAVAHGLREAPRWIDPVLAMLQERGFEHEADYVDDLRAQELAIIDLREVGSEEAIARSIEAMRAGADVIVQPALRQDRWFGRPDILRRTSGNSALGDWRYEVYDTKLTRETRGGTILQLTLYSELIADLQRVRPAHFHVVTPGSLARELQTFRLDDFSAYFRLIRRRLELTTTLMPEEVAGAHYPDPVDHCEVCRWWTACDHRRRADDHLCLVAGISRSQIRELRDHDVATLAHLARLPVPIPFRPERGAVESYERIREQARVQLEARGAGGPVHELLLPIDPEHGLSLLPAPSPGDMFLDLEGDPFAGTGGREYLFGVAWIAPAGEVLYRGAWALGGQEEERQAFEQTMRMVLDAWGRDPGMHVYHFTAYEPAAFKRLMGRYALFETEMDSMLRAGLFVDLHAIVKRAVRASVEGYSLKELEAFHRFERDVDLADARVALRVVERGLELKAEAARVTTPDVLGCVEGYNRDDCVSTLRLRDWLEEQRDTLLARGIEVPRPAVLDGAPSEKLDERAQRLAALRDALTIGVPMELVDRDAEQQARWLLANMLEWHRREDKAPWWEFFRLCTLTEDEMFDERTAVARMTFVQRVGGTPRCPMDRYTFPPQECVLRANDELRLADQSTLGTVVAFDAVSRTIDVKKAGAHAESHPSCAFAFTKIPSKPLPESIERMARTVSEAPDEADGAFHAALALLRGEPPRLRGGSEFRQRDGESPLDFAVRIAPELDRTILPIQGPPGSGKSYTGAHMICALVEAGMKVGVTAVSHRVIEHLLEAVDRVAHDLGKSVACAQKVKEAGPESGAIRGVGDYPSMLSGVRSGEIQVAGGTAWMWAREEFAGSVDVLFVDEAGQMSLANVIAVSPAARSLVLLGDTQQLEQPIQGSHPEGTGVSALQHILGEHQTIPPDRGIFLPETWRLHPDICAFTSEVFYEGRLRSHDGLERQVLVGTGPFEGAGLWVVPVRHDGNQTSSTEEGGAVERIVTLLLGAGSRWLDRDAKDHPVTASDILVVAPYNAHVSLLEERLSRTGVRVGTVDRFQGQEAPVVIYSMATSTQEDAPRGMEFLYSSSRLNVATSRARCASILIANPRLFEPECRTPRQMKLANALCRYVELARWVDLDPPEPGGA